MTAILVTKWPAMKVSPVSFLKLLREWATADEIASGELTGDVTASFPAIDLPPTEVEISPGSGLAIWRGNGIVGTVAACIASAPGVEIDLDAEPVVMENGVLIAKAMLATAKVTINGQVWSSAGTVQPSGYGFPDCPIVGGVASPVTASFLLAKV